MENAFDDFWDQLDTKQKKCLNEVRTKYRDNPWWKSDDPAVVLRYQIEERALVVSFSKYIDMLGKFLQRRVDHMEFAFDYERIKSDVRSALKRKELGTRLNEEQLETAHNDQIRRVTSIIETKLPKDKVMKIDLSKKPEKNDGETDDSGYDGWLKPR